MTPTRAAWRAMVVVVLLAAAVLVVPVEGGAQTPGGGEGSFPSGAQAQGLSIVGYSDLGGEGLNGEVALVGTTAIVASGYMPLGFVPQSNTSLASLTSAPPCPAVSVKVVDLADPTRPRVAATIPVPMGQVAREVDALRVETRLFTGDLAAVAFATCQYDEQLFRTSETPARAATPTAAWAITTLEFVRE